MPSWNDTLIIGVTQIDKEHKKLFTAVDRLLGALKRGEGREKTAQMLNYAVTYTKEHFRDEENLQERFAYPGINAHKRQHAQFILQANELVKDFGTAGPNVALTIKINKAMVDWLINHINTEDKKFGEHMTKAIKS